MGEELVDEAPFGLRGQYENIWHIALAERWSDGNLVGHRTYCGRNYPDTQERPARRGPSRALFRLLSPGGQAPLTHMGNYWRRAGVGGANSNRTVSSSGSTTRRPPSSTKILAQHVRHQEVFVAGALEQLQTVIAVGDTHRPRRRRIVSVTPGLVDVQLTFAEQAQRRRMQRLSCHW